MCVISHFCRVVTTVTANILFSSEVCVYQGKALLIGWKVMATPITIPLVHTNDILVQCPLCTPPALQHYSITFSTQWQVCQHVSRCQLIARGKGGGRQTSSWKITTVRAAQMFMNVVGIYCCCAGWWVDAWVLPLYRLASTPVKTHAGCTFSHSANDRKVCLRVCVFMCAGVYTHVLKRASC